MFLLTVYNHNINVKTTYSKRRPGTEYTDAGVVIQQDPNSSPVTHVETTQHVHVHVVSKCPMQWIINTHPLGEWLLEVDETYQTDITHSGTCPATGHLVIRE